MNTYYTEDKFDGVIKELNRRGLEFTKVDSTCVVNHFEGSQHFSNKAYLAYHLCATDHLHLCPPTWSPSYQSLSDLYLMLLCYETGSRWEELEDDYLSRIEYVHRQMRMLSVLQKNNSLSHPETLTSYQEFLQQLSTQIDITVLRDGFSDQFCRKDENNHNIWIIKPIGLSCGEKIQLGQGLYQTIEIAKSFEFKCIIQKYIENPLLVRQLRKFDIRQWIVVTSLHPLVIFGFSEGYLRLSSKSFSLQKESLQDSLMHLCNHAIQKNASTTSENDELHVMTEDYLCDTMMTQDEFILELYERYSSESKDAEKVDIFRTIIQPQIRQISIDVVNSIRDRLLRVGKGFEWLGLDLIVTSDFKVKLLEVNTSPDVSYSTPVTTRLVDEAIPALFDLLSTLDDTLNAKFSSTPPACKICVATACSPHWCCWHIEQTPTNVLQVSSIKRKKLKLQTKCIPQDTGLYELLKDNRKGGISSTTYAEDENEDEI